MKFRKNDNQMYNFICEIPKWTRDKFEINTKLKSNPIKQDIEDNKPRVYIGVILFLIMELYLKPGKIPTIFLNLLI